MKKGDKLIVTRKNDITQSYIPWGSTCEYLASFDRYVCVLYQHKEYLINKDLLEEAAHENG
tara:strand:+ start:1198 stop:1380 length:183 start_codon:yes stop_codon:yes gene_type:complete